MGGGEHDGKPGDDRHHARDRAEDAVRRPPGAAPHRPAHENDVRNGEEDPEPGGQPVAIGQLALHVERHRVRGRLLRDVAHSCLLCRPLRLQPERRELVVHEEEVGEDADRIAHDVHAELVEPFRVFAREQDREPGDDRRHVPGDPEQAPTERRSLGPSG